MALDLSGFATPEKSYNQLYNLGEANERREFRRSQLAEQRRAKRAANATMLTGLLDPKQHLSGSLYDPVISKSLQDMLAEGAQLADEGADANMILMALGPKVAKVSEYAQKAKLLKKEKDEFEQQIKPIKGIDKQKALNAYDDMAYFEVDPNTGEKKMKDVSDIDVQKKYADQVLRDADVYNNEGLQELVKTAGKETRVSDFRYYNKLGSLNRTKGAYTAPPFYIPEEDERGAFKEFVPQYDIVTEGGVPKELEFHTDKGNVKAPVRMVTDEVFNKVLRDQDKAFIRQEVRKYAKEHGVELSSPQAYTLAKAIAYDELKENGKFSSSVSELVDNKPSTFQIKVDNGIPYYKPSSGGSGGDTSINDVQGRLSEKVSVNFDNGGRGTSYNSLANDEQEVVRKAVENAGYRVQERGKNIFLMKDGDKIRIYRTTDGKTIPNESARISELPFIGTNLAKQPDVKTKRAVVQHGNTPSSGKEQMVTMEVNGKKGQIPASKVAEFQKKYPNAKRL